MNEHGIPVASSVMSGNTSDKVWNEKALDFVADVFEKQMPHCIFIADSKLINKNLFQTMMNPQKRIQFISRCPANFSNKLAEEATQKAYDEGNWEDIGVISERKGAAEYKVQEFSEEVFGSTVRLLVYQTSEGIKRFEKKKEKQLHELEKDISEVEKNNLPAKPMLEKNWNVFKRLTRKAFLPILPPW